MIFERQWSSEDRHQSVTDDLVHDSALAVDCVHHQCVVVVQQLDRLNGLGRLRDRRERADVAEHRRRVQLLASKREPGAQQILRHFLRCELADQLTLLVAQTLLLGTKFIDFIGYNAWVGEAGGIGAVQVTEWDEPQAVIGSYLHRYAYPDLFKAHQDRGQSDQRGGAGRD